MLPIRQAFQVLRAVVVFPSIEMVDNPAFGNWLSVSFFPDKDMLTDIPIPICSMVSGPMNKDIPRTSYPTTFPIMMFSFPLNQICYFASHPSSFLLATLTSLGKPPTNRVATINTEFRLDCPSGFMSTIRTSARPFLHQLTTVKPGMLGLFLIFYLCLVHIIIITYTYLNSKVREIVEAADKAGIPVFLKDSLKPLLPHSWFKDKPSADWAYTKLGKLRQEMPK